jgi:multicomponent Na+:H+ antiporter subunit A
MPVLPINLAILAGTGLILWVMRPHEKRFMGWLAALPPGLMTAWLFLQIPAIEQGATISTVLTWVPSLGIEFSFRLDGLALLFGLIITGIGAGVALYTHDYLERDPRQGYFYALLFIFMTSMLGLVWADNLLTLFIFWEGTSISSYLLIGFNDTEAQARTGARNALIITAGGGLAMLAGLVLLGQQAGTYSVSEIVATPGLTSLALYPAAVILVMAGAFTKSAQFPFQFWLPGAMAAPTPASAYLHSATMVKAGIYLLARFHPALHDSPIWFWGLLGFGGLTMLIGAVAAMGQWDIKGLLAYATVSELGVLTMLLAFDGQAAAVAVTVGILAHALYKGPLFLVAGIVDHATGTRDIRQLAALWRNLPWPSAAGILAGLSMAGLPPLLGFMAKETLLESLLHFAEHTDPTVGWLALGAALIAGALFVAYSFSLLWEVFLRREANAVEQAQVHHRPRFSFFIAPLALVLIGTAAPWSLSLLTSIASPTVASITGSQAEVHLAILEGLTPVFVMSMTAIVVGAGIFLARRSMRRLLSLYPASLGGANLFQQALDGLFQVAGWVEYVLQGRALATHAGFTVLAGLSALLFAITRLNPSDMIPALPAAVDPSGTFLSNVFPEMVLAFLAIIAALSVARAQTRLGAIISLGVVGIAVTLFYVLFSAPDLALTQLLIEVLTVVLLVLVFAKVPPDRLPPIGLRRQAFVLFVSLAAGLFGFGLVLFNVAPALHVADSISGFYLANSLSQAHGANVVNVILVDFRGFDTMGEITVLAIAALGGYALLRAPRFLSPDTVRPVKDRRGRPSKASSAGQPVAVGEAHLAPADTTVVAVDPETDE